MRRSTVFIKRRHKTYTLIGLLVLLTLAIFWRETLLLQIETSRKNTQVTHASNNEQWRVEVDGSRDEQWNGGGYQEYRKSQPSPQPNPPETSTSVGSGFDATHLFHVTNNGTFVEGYVFLKLRRRGIFPIEREGWAVETYTMGKTYRFLLGRCYWCPRKLGLEHASKKDCRYGYLRAGPHKDDHGTHKTYKHRNHMLNLRTGSTDEVYNKVKDFSTTYLRCQIYKTSPPIPDDVEGILRVEKLPDFVFYVNPGKRTVPNKDSSVVCLKSNYGSGLSTHSVAQFVSHYLNVFKFSRVVMYEQGLLRGMITADLTRDPRILDWVNKRQFQIVDMRDSLQRLYGALGSDVTQFSGKQGQIMTIGDCSLRAKVDGYEWVLHVDRDEILAPGPAMVHRGHVESWAEMVHRVERERQNADLLPLRVIEFKSIRPNESMICDECQALDIDKLMRWSRSNEDLMTMNISYPKSAVRLDAYSEYPMISTIGIHNVARYAAFERGLHTDNVTQFMPVHQYHIRHYNCLNEAFGKCETVPFAFAPRYEWAEVQGD